MWRRADREFFYSRKGSRPLPSGERLRKPHPVGAETVQGSFALSGCRRGLQAWTATTKASQGGGTPFFLGPTPRPDFYTGYLRMSFGLGFGDDISIAAKQSDRSCQNAFSFLSLKHVMVLKHEYSLTSDFGLDAKVKPTLIARDAVVSSAVKE